MCETATAAPLGVANHHHLISLHSPHRGAPGLRNTTPAPEKRAEDLSIAHHLLSAAPSRKAYYSYRAGAGRGFQQVGIAAKGGQGAGTRSVERPGAVNLGAAAEGVQEHSMSAQPIA